MSVTLHLSPLPSPVQHAALRWAQAVLGILHCTFDPSTIGSWGRVIGVSGSAIRQWCRNAGVRPKASLDFARVLRAVVLSQGRPWDAYNLLDVVDERTMRKLFVRAGIPGVLLGPEPPETMRYLSKQTFVRSEAALQAVLALLQADERPDGIEAY